MSPEPRPQTSSPKSPNPLLEEVVNELKKRLTKFINEITTAYSQNLIIPVTGEHVELVPKTILDTVTRHIFLNSKVSDFVQALELPELTIMHEDKILRLKKKEELCDVIETPEDLLVISCYVEKGRKDNDVFYVLGIDGWGLCNQNAKVRSCIDGHDLWISLWKAEYGELGEQINLVEVTV